MWLLLYNNRNSYLGSPVAPLYLILSDIECQIQGHPDFEVLYHKPLMGMWGAQ